MLKLLTDAFGLNHPVGRILAIVASVNLFAMMLLTLADVVGRYLFNAPVPGAFEITEIMMGILVFAIFPIITAREEHLSIGLLDHFYKGHVNRVRMVLLSFLNMAFIGLLCWRVWVEAGKNAAYGDHTAYLHIPIAPVVYFMAVMALITLLAALAVLWDHLRRKSESVEATKGK